MGEEEEKQIEQLEDVEDLSGIEKEMPPEDESASSEQGAPEAGHRENLFLSFALCDDIAHYSGLASWAFLVLFILGAAIDQPLMQSIGMFGTIVTISLSMLFDELAARKIGEGRGGAGMAVLALVGAALIASVAGYALARPEIVAGGVFGLLVLSFVPAIIDHFKGADGDDDYLYRPRASSGYSEFGEIFGVHTPKPQPPITVERGEDLDDDWQEYLGIEIPDVESLRKTVPTHPDGELDKLEDEASVGQETLSQDGDKED